MRDDRLSKRVFAGRDDIVALGCEAWNKLVDQPWRIMTIGHRTWAHGFRSMAVGSLDPVAASPLLFVFSVPRPSGEWIGSWFSSASAVGAAPARRSSPA